jgi:hypothetical protein
VRTVSSYEFEAGFSLSVSTFLADTLDTSKERALTWYSDYANYLLIRYDQIEPQLVCICVVAEQWLLYESLPVDSAEWSGSDQLWHRLAFQILNDELRVFRDGQVVFEHVDPQLADMPTSGYVELSNTYASTCFDEILLLSYPQEQ